MRTTDDIINLLNDGAWMIGVMVICLPHEEDGLKEEGGCTKQKSVWQTRKYVFRVRYMYFRTMKVACFLCVTKKRRRGKEKIVE